MEGDLYDLAPFSLDRSEGVKSEDVGGFRRDDSWVDTNGRDREAGPHCIQAASAVSLILPLLRARNVVLESWNERLGEGAHVRVPVLRPRFGP